MSGSCTDAPTNAASREMANTAMETAPSNDRIGKLSLDFGRVDVPELQGKERDGHFSSTIQSRPKEHGCSVRADGEATFGCLFVALGLIGLAVPDAKALTATRDQEPLPVSVEGNGRRRIGELFFQCRVEASENACGLALELRSPCRCARLREL